MNIRVTCLAALIAAAAAVAGASPASAQAVQFFAVLAGGNEVSGAGAADAGDPDGSGVAAAQIISSPEICLAVVVVRINAPTLMHIHEETAGENGGIVVHFTPPTAGNPGTSSECVEAPAAVIARIRSTPSRFYVNVHTGAFPGGAVRGQLF
jgi:hypothetical protein